MKSESKCFKLKIRPNGRSQFEVLATSEMLVSELKAIITSFCQIPTSQQKLICQGKLLKDDVPLSFYKLADGYVLQLSIQTQERISSDQAESSTGRRERTRGLEPNERYETISQSLQTVGLMLDILTPRSEEEIIGFDNSQRKFSPGQWVDVLDTVEQWLEAQILEIANASQGTLVFIHYNGWPAQ